MEGDAGVVDPVSTVSSRIALLPANVCHVWHTRRAPRTAVHGRMRVRGLRGACKSGAGAHMRTFLSCHVCCFASRHASFL